MLRFGELSVVTCKSGYALDTRRACLRPFSLGDEQQFPKTGSTFREHACNFLESFSLIEAWSLQKYSKQVSERSLVFPPSSLSGRKVRSSSVASMGDWAQCFDGKKHMTEPFRFGQLFQRFPHIGARWGALFSPSSVLAPGSDALCY